MSLQPAPRRFVFQGSDLPDPDPSLSVADIQRIYSTRFPELTTAAVEKPKVENGVVTYTFVRAVGAKG